MADLIYGPTILALTDHILDDVSNLSQNWPEARAIILVPENRKLAIETRYLENSGSGGLMMAEVLSFSRLSHRIFDLAGIRRHDRLSREGQAMLLSSLIEEHKDNLKIFHRLATRSGYIERIVSVMGYLRRYGVNSSALLRAAENSTDSTFRAKFHDFSFLLSYYQAELQRLGRSDSEKSLEDLARLLESLCDGSCPLHVKKRLTQLKSSHIWVGGFGESREFTPQEYRILSALDQIAFKLKVSVVTDTLTPKREDMTRVKPAFNIGSRTAIALSEYLDIEHTAYIVDTSIRNKEISQALDHEPVTPTLSEDSIQLRIAAQIIDEVSDVAGQIKRYTFDGRYRYKDIAVALADQSSYLPYIRTIFQEYEVPAFIDTRRSLADTPLYRFVLALIDTALSHWRRDHLLSLMRSGIPNLSFTETDVIENYWLASGMRYSGVFSLERYPDELRDLVSERLLPLRAPIESLNRQKSCRGLLAHLKKIFRLPQLSVEGWIHSEIERLTVAGMDEYAVSLAKAWNSLGEILTDLELLYGDKPMDLTQLRNVLNAAAESNFAGIIPTNIDQINVGSTDQILGAGCKILFVMGAKNELFPPGHNNNGLLKDSDCDILAETEGIRIPGLGRYQAEEDAFIVRQLFSTPKEHLILSFSGKLQDSASPVSVLTEVFGVKAVELPRTAGSPDDLRLMSAAELQRRLILRASNHDLTAEGYWRRLENCIVEKVGNVRSQQNHLLKTEEQDGEEGQAALTRELLRFMPNLSVSALETYAACPYQYMVQYLLRVSERDVAEPTAMNRGSLLHVAFEQAFRELSQALASAQSNRERTQVWEDYMKRDPSAESDRLFHSAIEKQPEFGIFDEYGQKIAAGRPVKKVIAVAWPALLKQLRESDYIPYTFEHRFGGQNPIPSLQFYAEDGLTLTLRGTIDRVDIRRLPTGEIGFRVLDYKSSDHPIRYSDLIEGLDLQILTYLEAVSAGGLPDIAAGRLIAEDAMYMKLDESHLTVDEMPLDYEAELEKQLKKYYTPAGFRHNPEELTLLMKMNHENWQELASNIVSGRFPIDPKLGGGAHVPCEFCLNRQACTMESVSAHASDRCSLSGAGQKLGTPVHVKDLLDYLRDRYAGNELSKEIGGVHEEEL